MRDLSYIKKEIEDIIKLCQTLENVVALYIFGSYGTANQSLLSDIDIAVLFKNKTSLEEELDFEIKISEIFKRNDIDIVILNKAPIDIQMEVLYKGERIYCSDELSLADFKEQVFYFYSDYEPTLREFYNDILEGIKNE